MYPRIVVLEAVGASVAHLGRVGDEGAREEAGHVSGSRRGRRAGVGAGFDGRELHDALFKAFSHFGNVTYVNEHLFLTEGNALPSLRVSVLTRALLLCGLAPDLLAVFFTAINDAQGAKEEVEKNVRQYLRSGIPCLVMRTSVCLLREATPSRPVVNTLGAHVEKGEPDWGLIKIRYEDPKTLTLPVTAGTTASLQSCSGLHDSHISTCLQATNRAGTYGWDRSMMPSSPLQPWKLSLEPLARSRTDPT